MAKAIGYMIISYMAISYGDWVFASGYGYWYWLWTIWIVIGFGFKTSFYVGLNVWFLGFKVRVQVWSDF
jgi:hypothetical protein